MRNEKNDKEYLDRAFPALSPPEDITVAPWAEKNIILPELTCPEPGPFKISRTPYVRGPLDAFSSPYIDHIVYVWGRQTAKSTSIYVCMAYGIAQDPGPGLFVLPTVPLAKYTSNNRLQTIFDICDSINQKKTSNADDYSTLEMKFTDSVLSIVGGGSGAQVMSRPVRYLYRDEIDELKASLGVSNTDPMMSSEETTSNFGNRKIIDTSTPSTTEGNVWLQLRSCQQVFEYWVPCPHCGGYQILIWEQIKFPKEDRDPESVSLMTWYECVHCQGHIRNMDKPKILLDGEWRARLTGDPCDDILKNEPVSIENTVSLTEVLQNFQIKKIGFHLPKWYSPFPNSTFGYAAKEFLKAQGDYNKMRDWTKFWAARPWVDRVQTKSYSELMSNKIDIPPTLCPADTIALTCTIDPGQGGFWYVVLAWQKNTNRHVVQYGFLPSWDAVEQVCFENTHEVIGTNGGRLRIWRKGVDVGGSKYDETETMTEAAYNWIRKHQCRDLFGVQGSNRSNRSSGRVKLSIRDKMPGKGQVIPGGLAVWIIDTDSFKDAIHYHLRAGPDDPGRLTFHSKTNEDLISHILAEERQRQKNGQFEWVSVKQRPNHLLDCLVYGFALADPECAGGVMVLRPPFESRPSRIEEPPADQSAGWLDGIGSFGI